MPLFDMVSLETDTPPVPLRGSPYLLSGIRILDLTHVIAGPLTTRTLAEYGAEVISIRKAGRPDRPYYFVE